MTEIDIKPDYIKFLKQYKGDFSNLKIAFDLSNGMANLFAKEIYKDENAEWLFDTIDGRFPNHEPNPLIPKNVQPLKDLVAKCGADLGVIYDGDADRVMFVDDKARFVAPDLIIAMMAKYFCDERGEKNPRVLQEIRSSKAVGEYLQQYGAIPASSRKSVLPRPWESICSSTVPKSTPGVWAVPSQHPSSAKSTVCGAVNLPATTISRISSIPIAECSQAS